MLNADCVAAQGIYKGNGSLCATAECVAAEGACCVPDGSCTFGGEDGCQAAGNTYQGDGTDCPSINCPLEPLGACCLENACTELTATECVGVQGDYQGDVACTGSLCSAIFADGFESGDTLAWSSSMP
jgi:hypothetical protein